MWRTTKDSWLWSQGPSLSVAQDQPGGMMARSQECDLGVMVLWLGYKLVISWQRSQVGNLGDLVVGQKRSQPGYWHQW